MNTIPPKMTATTSYDSLPVTITITINTVFHPARQRQVLIIIVLAERRIVICIPDLTREGGLIFESGMDDGLYS